MTSPSLSAPDCFYSFCVLSMPSENGGAWKIGLGFVGPVEKHSQNTKLCITVLH